MIDFSSQPSFLGMGSEEISPLWGFEEDVEAFIAAAKNQNASYHDQLSDTNVTIEIRPLYTHIQSDEVSDS